MLSQEKEEKINTIDDERQREILEKSRQHFHGRHSPLICLHVRSYSET